MTNFDKVGEFMTTFKQEVLTKAQIPYLEIQDLRYELIREELEEFKHALYAESIVDIADALADLLYVVYGAGHAFGIDLDACFTHIHESNMSKLGPDGEPIFREDGKVLKGPGYWAPNLTLFV